MHAVPRHVFKSASKCHVIGKKELAVPWSAALGPNRERHLDIGNRKTPRKFSEP